MQFTRHTVRSVPIHKVHGPGNLRQLLEDPGVAELAESIEKYGLLHPPTVNKATGELIAGRKRYAAHVLLKRDTIEVAYLDVEDLHARILELVENIHRRHDPREQANLRIELVNVLEKEERALEEAGAVPPETRRGPKSTPRSRAIRRAVQETGASESTIRRQLNRTEEAQRKKEEEAKRLAKRPHIETFGLEVPKELMRMTRAMQKKLAGMANDLAQMQRLWSGFANSNPVYKTESQAFIQALNGARDMAERMKPFGVCPSCKLIETLQPACTSCFGKGYVFKEQFDYMPEDLIRKSTLYVQHGANTGDPRIVPYDSMFDDYEPPEPEPEPKRHIDMETMFKKGELKGVFIPGKD